MTVNCRFHRTEVVMSRNTEKHNARFERPPVRVAVKWCAAPNSVVTRQMATGATTAAKLVCGGDLGRCQIPGGPATGLADAAIAPIEG